MIERLWSKTAFGRRHAAGGPRIRRHRHAQRAPESLEHGLGNMVGVAAAQAVDVQRHQRVIDETLEELAQQIDVELADPGRNSRVPPETVPRRAARKRDRSG